MLQESAMRSFITSLSLFRPVSLLLFENQILLNFSDFGFDFPSVVGLTAILKGVCLFPGELSTQVFVLKLGGSGHKLRLGVPLDLQLARFFLRFFLKRKCSLVAFIFFA